MKEELINVSRELAEAEKLERAAREEFSRIRTQLEECRSDLELARRSFGIQAAQAKLAGHNYRSLAALTERSYGQVRDAARDYGDPAVRMSARMRAMMENPDRKGLMAG